MKTKIYTALIATLALSASAALQTQPSVQAEQTETQFICADGYDEQTQQTHPTTFAWTPEGKIVVVRWTSKVFSNYSPQQRCEVVSQRMHEAYHNGTLNFITNGTSNGQRVICTANQPGESCAEVLMTLRPEDDSIAILNHFRDLFNGYQVGPVRHSSGEPQVYYQIDVDGFLANQPVVQD